MVIEMFGEQLFFQENSSVLWIYQMPSELMRDCNYLRTAKCSAYWEIPEAVSEDNSLKIDNAEEADS